MKRVSVLYCPRHGQILNKKTIEYTLDKYAQRITIAFCKFCDCYYTISPPLETAMFIDGKCVRQASGVREVLKSVLPKSSLPFLIDDYKSDNKNKSKKTIRSDSGTKIAHNSKNSRNERLHTSHEKTTTESCNFERTSNMIIENYYLDSSSGLTDICPKCNSITDNLKCNIPMYDMSGVFRALRVASLRYCYQCGIGFIAQDELERLLITNNGMSQQYTFKPKNAKIKNIPDSNIYYFAPIANFALQISYNTGCNSEESRLRALNKESFLKKLGYRIDLSNESRHIILEKAASIKGVRWVVSFLRFLIQTHPNSENAIHIWTDDIDYLLNKYKFRGF